MKAVTIVVERAVVYSEISKATDYTGSKLLSSDVDARDRIYAVDADIEEMGRFWDEAVTTVNAFLGDVVLTSENSAERYVATIEVSSCYEQELNSSVEAAIRSYFVLTMLSKWFDYVNKGDVEHYATMASERLLTAGRLLSCRRRPVVPS